jgi:hypothetical protein
MRRHKMKKLNIFKLPTDVTRYKVLSFFTLKDLARFERANKYLYSLADSAAWKRTTEHQLKRTITLSHSTLSNKSYSKLVYKLAMEIAEIKNRELPQMYGAGLYHFFEKCQNDINDKIDKAELKDADISAISKSFYLSNEIHL